VAVRIKAQKAAEEALLKSQTMFLVTMLMFSPGKTYCFVILSALEKKMFFLFQDLQ